MSVRIFQCLLVAACALMLVLVLSIVDTLVVFAVSDSGNSPGDGMLVILLFLVSLGGGFVSGAAACTSIYKIGFRKARRTIYGSLCLLCGVSSVSTAFILFWAGPPGFEHRLLSITAAIAFTLLSTFLLWAGLRKFGLQLSQIP